MGYSCTARADDILKQWYEQCASISGMTNVYKVGDTTYCLEQGKEQRDGAITGTTLRLEGDKETGYTGYPCGSWRINADGTVKRYPTGLRKVLGN